MGFAVDAAVGEVTLETRLVVGEIIACCSSENPPFVIYNFEDSISIFSMNAINQNFTDVK